jgi:hypothetical protein
VTNAKTNKHVNINYKVCDKILTKKDGILHKAESIQKNNPGLVSTVHTNGAIRIQSGTKLERINIQRRTPFSEELLY